jgi:hypothetical protein
LRTGCEHGAGHFCVCLLAVWALVWLVGCGGCGRSKTNWSCKVAHGRHMGEKRAAVTTAVALAVAHFATATSSELRATHLIC